MAVAKPGNFAVASNLPLWQIGRAMQLEAYLKERGISRSEFAQRLGVYPSTITRLIDGSRRPSGALLADIVRETDGAVNLSDFDWISDEPNGGSGEMKEAG
jgi:transcriptional regulator with XRE-family HTH domain